MPKRKNSRVANTSPSFQPKFFVMLNMNPVIYVSRFKRQSEMHQSITLCGFSLLVRGDDGSYRRSADLNPQIVRWNPQVNIVVLQRDDSSPDAAACHNSVTCLQFI